MLKFVTARTGISLFRERLGARSESENPILACQMFDVGEAPRVHPRSLDAWICEVLWLENAIFWFQPDGVDGRSERGICSGKVQV